MSHRRAAFYPPCISSSTSNDVPFNVCSGLIQNSARRCSECLHSALRDGAGLQAHPISRLRRKHTLSALQSFACPISKFRGERPLSGIGSCYFALAAKVWIPPVVTNCARVALVTMGSEPSSGASMLVECCAVSSNVGCEPIVTITTVAAICNDGGDVVLRCRCETIPL